MNAKEIKQKLTAAKALLSEGTTIDRAQSVLTLLKGVHKGLDPHLSELEKALRTLGKVEAGDLATLSVEALPETTDEERRRKKALLFFLRSWNALKSEVARVESEMDRQQHNSQSQSSMWRNILGHVTGPVGLITLVAVGLATLHTVQVAVTIENHGCGTIETSSAVPIMLPGLSLPHGPIEDGDSRVAYIPPLSVSVVGSGDTLSLSAVGLHLSIDLSGVDTITLDGISLMGHTTTVDLGASKTHVLSIRCH